MSQQKLRCAPYELDLRCKQMQAGRLQTKCHKAVRLKEPVCIDNPGPGKSPQRCVTQYCTIMTDGGVN